MCYLVAEGRRHPRRELAELLWPESEEHRARADLRAVLHKLRKSLGEESARDGVAGSFVVDGDRSGTGAAGDRARPAGARSGCLAGKGRDLAGWRRKRHHRRTPGAHRARLQGALGLYRGDFMEGFSLENAPEYELWLEAGRARWRALFGELCEGLSGSKGRKG